MFIRKLKRICDVRGCRCRDTFSISMSREAGNTIIVCRKCLKDALKEIERLYPEKTDEEAVVNVENAENVVEVTPHPSAELTPSPQGEGLSDGLNEAVYGEDELLNGMTVKELKAFAAEIGADVSKCKVKADFVEVIKTATAESLKE